MRYVLAVAKLGHFGKAAEECNAAPSTLSGQIRRLEGYLGTPLFERRNGDVKLTPFGEQAMPMVRSMVEAADRLVALRRGRRPQSMAPGQGLSEAF